TALQDGDSISRMDNDVGYITIDDIPVRSVSGKTGDVELFKSDIADFDESDYATSVQGDKADSALQSGDNVSELNNDAGYLTDADMSDYVTEDELNNKGYLTDADMSDYVKEEDLEDYVKDEDLEDYVKEEDLED